MESLRLLPLLVLAPSAFAQVPPNYYAAVDTSNPAVLRTSLHGVIHDHVRFPYTATTTDTWDILELADQDPANAGNVVDLYMNQSLPKQGGGVGIYNREHTWPNSYGFPNDGSTNYLVASALDHRFEVVCMPYGLAVPARPLMMQPLPTHRVLDLTSIRTRLGYRDAVPARDALARTARWLAANPPERGGDEETILTDPFDYAAEDRLIASWQAAERSVAVPPFDLEPRYGLAYSGPGGRPRSKAVFEP